MDRKAIKIGKKTTFFLLQNKQTSYSYSFFNSGTCQTTANKLKNCSKLQAKKDYSQENGTKS